MCHVPSIQNLSKTVKRSSELEMPVTPYATFAFIRLAKEEVDGPNDSCDGLTCECAEQGHGS
jgi:hypothetical protein